MSETIIFLRNQQLLFHWQEHAWNFLFDMMYPQMSWNLYDKFWIWGERKNSLDMVSIEGDTQAQSCVLVKPPDQK